MDLGNQQGEEPTQTEKKGLLTSSASVKIQGDSAKRKPGRFKALREKIISFAMGAGNSKEQVAKSVAKQSQPGGQNPTTSASAAGGSSESSSNHHEVDQNGSCKSADSPVPNNQSENDDGNSVTAAGQGHEDASVPPKPADPAANPGSGWLLLVRNLQKRKAEDERDNLKKKNEELTLEIESLKKENRNLLDQIETAESRHSRTTPAHGVYAGSEADPILLQKVANDVKQSLTDLAATVKESLNSEGTRCYRDAQGISGNRIKFVIQAELCSLAFEGLWETDDFFYQCLPEYADLEKSKKAHFARYKHVESLLKPSREVLNSVILEGQEPQSCGSTNSCTACGIGPGGGICPDLRSLVELRNLFRAKHEKFIKTHGNFLPSAKVSESEFRQGFLRFIIHVWLAHRLTLAFEQPAALFKVKAGQKYLPDHMEATVEEDCDPDCEPTVAFMIIPGFRVGKAFIKSVVHLTLPDQVKSTAAEVATQVCS